MKKFQILFKININIQKHNNSLRESRQQKTKDFKKKKKLKQIWKYKQLSKKKNGID